MLDFVDALRLEGCWDVRHDSGVYEFPCGLAIADDLADYQMAPPAARLLHEAHERHHYEKHEDKPWCIVGYKRGTAR